MTYLPNITKYFLIHFWEKIGRDLKVLQTILNKLPSDFVYTKSRQTQNNLFN